jgi:glycine/D-amino acid oxidase-like deaminating enzyme
MSESAEVVVIGGGVAGLSTARALVELGVTDVLVLERSTIASGGSGKTSGVVRCHYGIRSLAAMAWHSLDVLEHAPGDPGCGVRIPPDRATWWAWVHPTGARSAPMSPCTGNWVSTSTWWATIRPASSGRRPG